MEAYTKLNSHQVHKVRFDEGLVSMWPVGLNYPPPQYGKLTTTFNLPTSVLKTVAVPDLLNASCSQTDS